MENNTELEYNTNNTNNTNENIEELLFVDKEEIVTNNELFFAPDAGDPIEIVEAKKKVIKESVTMPNHTRKEIQKDIRDVINSLNQSEIAAMPDQDKLATTVSIVSEKFIAPDDTFNEKFTNLLENDKIGNSVKFLDKNLGIVNKSISLKDESGEIVRGNKAIAILTSELGLGEFVAVTLYHSGFTITLKPVRDNEIVMLNATIAREEIQLGRQTHKFIYSNLSVLYYQVLANFIKDHIAATTLAVPISNIMDYISIHDFPIILTAMLSSMYPKGYSIIRSCSSTKTNNCKSVISGVLQPRKLVWLDRERLSYEAFKQLAISKNNEITKEDVIKYQEVYSKHLLTKDVTIVSSNNIPITFTIKIPSVSKYLEAGQVWIDKIINMAESIFTQADKIEDRNKIIAKMATSSMLGIYSTYITRIKLNSKTGKILEITSNDNITETLSALSGDDVIVDKLLEAITKHIEDSAIAIVGIPNYICPVCQGLQKENGTGAFKNFIPLDVVSLFFELSGFKVMKKTELAAEIMIQS